MSKPIHLEVKHDLGIAGAKRAIVDRFAILKANYIDKIGTAELSWAGDVGTVRAIALGQKATATVLVGATDITIDIALPFLLSGMSGMIESVLKSNKDALRSHPDKAG